MRKVVVRVVKDSNKVKKNTTSEKVASNDFSTNAEKKYRVIVRFTHWPTNTNEYAEFLFLGKTEEEIEEKARNYFRALLNHNVWYLYQIIDIKEYKQ